MADEGLPDNICTSVAHYFEAAWSGAEGDGFGVIYCRWCGDIRAIEIPGIGAPAEEVLTTYRDGVPKVWREG